MKAKTRATRVAMVFNGGEHTAPLSVRLLPADNGSLREPATREGAFFGAEDSLRRVSQAHTQWRPKDEHHA